MDANDHSVRSYSQLLKQDQTCHSDDEVLNDKDVVIHRKDSILSKTSQKSQKSKMKGNLVPAQLALKITVMLLFLVIISGIGAIFHFHSLEKRMLRLSQKIQLNEDNRVLTVESNTSAKVLVGRMGMELPDFEMPFDCSDKHNKTHKCLRWKDKGQVDIFFESRVIDDAVAECHSIHWQDLSNVRPRDCYLMDGASWFGGGLLPHKTFPFGVGEIEYQDFLTSMPSDETGAGQVLEPLWLSTKGVAIIVDHTTPLAISVKNMKFERSKQRRFKHIDPPPDGKYLCLMPDISPELYLRLANLTRWLNYTICASTHIRAVQQYAMKYKVDKLRPLKDISILSKDIYTAVHLTSNFTQDDVLDFAEEIFSEGKTGKKILMMNPGWEAVPGDFTFDKKRFRNATEMFEVLHSYGFQVNLPVHPYISVHSERFGSTTDLSFFVLDGSHKNPGLTRMKCRTCEETTVAVFDVANPSAVEQLKAHINILKRDLKPDYITFMGGDASSLPFMAHQSGLQVNLYTKHYAKVAASSADPVWLQVAFSAQSVNPFIIMPCDDSDWPSLKRVLKRILTLGLIGYPDILQGVIGGCNPGNSSEELYVRWLQLGTFMPLLHFSGLPSSHSQMAAQVALNMSNIHERLVKPRLTRLVQDSVNNNYPLVRPLWWYNPNSPMAFDTTDQFLVGDTLLVAPVLKEGQTYRDIYLPGGKWKDESIGVEYLGPKWLRNYPAPVEKIPYFIRQ